MNSRGVSKGGTVGGQLTEGQHFVEARICVWFEVQKASFRLKQRWTIVAFGLVYVPKNVLEPCMWIFG